MEQWTALVHSRKSLSTAPLLECSNALKMKGPGGPGQSEGKGAIEQSNNRPHFPVAQCSIVHWSNALAIKKPGKSGLFYCLVGGTGIEPVTSAV